MQVLLIAKGNADMVLGIKESGEKKQQEKKTTEID
jgi:hypothetical protein